MNLIRHTDPFDGLSGLHKQLDDMFTSMWSLPSLPRLSTTGSTMDIYNDNDKSLVIEINAPGFTKDDISVQLNEGTLEVKGEKHERTEDTDKQRNYMVKESSSSFYRRVALPKNIDADALEAQFENGTLHLSVPFKELPKPKQVEVRSIEAKK
jgi:HSP20 family protein